VHIGHLQPTARRVRRRHCRLLRGDFARSTVEQQRALRISHHGLLEEQCRHQPVASRINPADVFVTALPKAGAEQQRPRADEHRSQRALLLRRHKPFRDRPASVAQQRRELLDM
jgi:hypothetical protein